MELVYWQAVERAGDQTRMRACIRETEWACVQVCVRSCVHSGDRASGFRVARRVRGRPQMYIVQCADCRVCVSVLAGEPPVSIWPLSVHACAQAGVQPSVGVQAR